MFTAKRRSKRDGTGAEGFPYVAGSKSAPNSHLRREAAAGVERQAYVLAAHAERHRFLRHRERDVVAAAGRDDDAGTADRSASRLVPSVDRDDTKARARQSEAAKSIRRVDRGGAERACPRRRGGFRGDRCRRAAARRRACARARRRRRARRDAAAARRARRRDLARPGSPNAGASGTSTCPRTARGSGRRTSRPDGTLSCVTPETPSSAFGRSTPCQWIDTPSRMSRFTSVASTRSPSCIAQLRARHAAVERQRTDRSARRQPDLRRLRNEADPNVGSSSWPPKRRERPSVPLVHRRAAAVVHRPELERAERAGHAARVPGDAEPDDDRDDRCESGDEREPLGPRRRTHRPRPLRQPALPPLRAPRRSGTTTSR